MNQSETGKNNLYVMKVGDTYTYDLSPEEAKRVRKAAYNHNLRTTKKFLTRYCMGRLFITRVA